LLIEYGCWRNVLSKELRMPVQFEYIATADTGNKARSDKFSLDETPGVPEWEPPGWARSDKYGIPYDVGHLVMANHFDGYKELIVATNLMTNVVPQLGNMNRFAWLATEYITECAREGPNKENVFVVGGCVWPEEPEHISGFEKMQRVTRKNPVPYYIKIPDYCWKVISTKNRGHLAFYIPNTDEARITKKTSKGPDGVQEGLTALNQFVVSVSELEKKLSDRQTPQSFSLGPGAQFNKEYKPSPTQMAEAGWSLACSQE
jgi:DNA/RNA endonuclease G (NUC1)